MYKEIVQLLKIIKDAEGLISIKEIASLMDVSSSKVKSLIKKANDVLPEEAGRIIGKAGNGQGYRLSIRNEEVLENFLNDLPSNESGLESREIRILNLLNILLSNESVKADDLSELLYVSRTQMTKDLNDVRELLKPYDLSLISVPYKGLSIEGSEFNKRLCLSSYLQRDIHFDWDQISFITESIPAEMKEKISAILYQELKEIDFQFSETAFQSLVIHLAIMLLRVKKGLKISDARIDFKDVDLSEDLFDLAKNILDRIAEEFSVEFSSGEEIYLSIHLAGKRYWENEENVVVSEQINSLTNRILQLIREEYHIDLFDCFDLRIQLNLHLIPLLTRIKYHLNMVNPLLNEIKSRFVYEFDIALNCCRIIEEEYDCHLSEDEISYIALYLGVQLDRNKTVNRKNILLVCQSGKVSSMIVKEQLQQRFPDYLGKLDQCLLMELDDRDLTGYDYIFTTVPIRTRVSIPIINIRFFLTKEELSAIGDVLQKDNDDIQGFFRKELFISEVKADTQEGIIKELVRTVEKYIRLPENFLDLVMERERISPTDFSYRIAMPHPVHPIDSDTFICIGVLPKAIHWKNRKVQIVLLISVKRKTSGKIQNFYRTITDFVSNKQKVNDLIEDPSFETFLKLIDQ